MLLVPVATAAAAAALLAAPVALLAPAYKRAGGLGVWNKVLDNQLLNPSDAANNTFLHGIYGPVAGCPEAVTCEVQGRIPPELTGEYLRTGSNPKLPPLGRYHWFDGDGMVHAVRLRGPDDAPLYSSRLVATERLEVEERSGRSQYPKIADLATKRGIASAMSYKAKVSLGLLPEAMGTGNTALVYHAGQLLALHEGDAPYVLRANSADGTVDTVGRNKFDGKLTGPFTAHPKTDPATGIMYAFGYQVASAPYVRFHVINTEGEMVRSFPLGGLGPIMMHDFVITESFAVLPDLPVRFDLSTAGNGICPFDLDLAGKARFGLLPLDAVDDSDLKWYDLPAPVGAYHFLNAWETKAADGTIARVDVAMAEYTDLSLKTFAGKCEMGEQKGRAVLYSIDMASGVVTRTPMVKEPEETLDFPMINEAYTGRRARYGYWTSFMQKQPLPLGIVKTDLDASMPADVEPLVRFGEGMYGGEVMFVPAASAVNKGPGDVLEEDDGYLLVYVVNGKVDNESELRIYNAKTMASEPAATIKIPARVPLGFHGAYLTQDEIDGQCT